MDTIIQSLIDKIAAIPYELRYICKILFILIKKKFNKISKYEKMLNWNNIKGEKFNGFFYNRKKHGSGKLCDKDGNLIPSGYWNIDKFVGKKVVNEFFNFTVLVFVFYII